MWKAHVDGVVSKGIIANKQANKQAKTKNKRLFLKNLHAFEPKHSTLFLEKSMSVHRVFKT